MHNAMPYLATVRPPFHQSCESYPETVTAVKLEAAFTTTARIYGCRLLALYKQYALSDDWVGEQRNHSSGTRDIERSPAECHSLAVRSHAPAQGVGGGAVLSRSAGLGHVLSPAEAPQNHPPRQTLGRRPAVPALLFLSFESGPEFSGRAIRAAGRQRRQ